MHALSHSLTHRGPGASRTRARWQPYTSSLTSSSTPSRSPANYLNTPVSSASCSPPPPPPPLPQCPNPSCHIERTRKVPVQLLTQQCQILGQSREAQKNRYVSRLVDQTVNSLCDIWHPDDIPQVFRTSSRTAFSAPTPSDSILQRESSPSIQAQYYQFARNAQLPSPISPSTQPSPCYTFNPSTSSANATIHNGLPDPNTRSSQLLPLKGFVHEVLRRSRTSTGVLQTALCYLEAVRGKIPDLLRKETTKMFSSDLDPVDRIVMAEPHEIEASLSLALDNQACVILTGGLDSYGQEPITAPPSCVPTAFSPPSATSTSRRPSPPLPPLPPLPSPLLCPRRTFLACLILASKFMQDRSYSNRAWAKLAGLPPREISRCERALGEALEWRLWVGKNVLNSTTTKSSLSSSRKPVARSWSESDAPPVSGACFSMPTRFTDAAPKRSSLGRSATVPNLGSIVGTQQQMQEGFFSALPSVVVDEPESLLAQPSLNTASYPQSSGLATELLQDQDDLSPPLSTPTLSYSPMSSVSSSSDEGERTFQVSGFLDLATPLPKHSSVPLLGQFDNSGFSFAVAKASAPLRLDKPVHAAFVIMDATPMPPMMNPAATPHGPFNLPPLSEALGNLHANHTSFKPQHSSHMSQLHDGLLSYWTGTPTANTAS